MIVNKDLVVTQTDYTKARRSTMKVRELIEVLQALDPTAPIFLTKLEANDDPYNPSSFVQVLEPIGVNNFGEASLLLKSSKPGTPQQDNPSSFVQVDFIII